MGNDDIYLNAIPHLDNPTLETLSQEPTVRRDMMTTSDEIKSHSGSGDNLLRDLRHYYCAVKTKRQLNMNVPAGFRQSSQEQKDFHQFLPPKSNFPLPPTSSAFSHLSTINESTEHNVNLGDTTLNEHSGIVGDTTLDLTSEPSPVTNSSSTMNAPILRCVDKCSSSRPSCITFSEDFIRSSVGYHRFDTIKHHLKALYQDTVKLDSTPPDAVLDMGDLATIRKKLEIQLLFLVIMLLEKLFIWILFLDLMSPLVIYIMVFCSLIGLVE